MARPKTKTAHDSIYAYEKENYARVVLLVPKEAKDQIRALADAEGVSMNRYIVEALEQRSGLKLTLDNALPWMNSDTKK